MMAASACSLSTTTAVSTVTAIVILSSLLWKHRQSSHAAEDDDLDDAIISHKLLKLEELLYKRDEPAISSLTWFKGDYTKASSILRHRVQAILEKNPWLTGRVVKRQGKLFLEYSMEARYSIDQFYFVVDPNESLFSRNTALEILGKLSENLLLKNGATEPIFRVLIVPCRTNPNENFAVIVSLSHIVGDGATFYELHSMLCSLSEDSIIKLIPERIPTSETQQAAAMGQEEFDYGTSFGMLINALSGLLRVKTIGPPVCSRIILLDTDKIEEAKRNAAMREDVPFVSTNDVLTSWFFQQSGCTKGLMYVNFRNRLDGHLDEYAGNYDNALFYNREDSETPGLIRKSLASMKRTLTSTMPSFVQTLQSTHAIATNWTSFAEPNVIQDCVEELHIPLYNVDGTVPYSFCVMVIFRAGPQQQCLYMIGQESVLNRLQSAPFFSNDKLE